MATVTKSIGTDGRDYSTISGWEADLDDTAIYASGDDAVGECYNDSEFDESVTIDGGGTVGLNSVTLTVASGERHDGTAGTGARIVLTTKEDAVPTLGLSRYDTELMWLECDDNEVDPGLSRAINFPDTGSNLPKASHLLIHDVRGSRSRATGIEDLCRDHPGTWIHNCIIYDVKATGASQDANGLIHEAGNSETVANITVYDIYSNSDNDPAYGADFENDIADITIKNIVVAQVINDGTYGEACFTPSSFSFASVSNNASSDGTAPGSNSLTNIVTADQFVSTTDGSEDLHLKSGADCIDAGADLGTTPEGVNIDIDGRDRDAEGDAWDIGADEYVSAGTGFNASWAHNANQVIQ